MAEAKHSEGPWWFVPGHGVRNRGGFLCHFNSVQRYPDQEERYAREVAEREADGHLMAAAPAMYEALKEAVSSGMVPVSSAAEGGAVRYSHVVRAADKIRAALAAAEGGE